MANDMTVTVSLSQKVNIGNYESVEAFVAVSGVPVGASEEDIQAALETGKVAYSKIAATLKEKVATIRENSRKVS